MPNNNFKAPGKFRIVSLTNENTLGVSIGIPYVSVNGSDTTWIVKNDNGLYSFGVTQWNVAKIFRNDKIVVSEPSGLGFDVGWTPIYRESDDAYTIEGGEGGEGSSGWTVSGGTLIEYQAIIPPTEETEEKYSPSQLFRFVEVNDPQGCIATDPEAAERSESGDAAAAQGATRSVE